MRTIRNQHWNFGFLQHFFFKNTKNALISTILVGCGWLTNLSVIFWLRKSMPNQVYDL